MLGRVLLLASLLLLLPSGAADPLACEGGVCVTREESHSGGSCENGDGQSAVREKYYNATFAGPAGSGARVELAGSCTNYEPLPGQSTTSNRADVGASTTLPGRTDRVGVVVQYGTYYIPECYAYYSVDPDRTAIFDFHESGDLLNRRCPVDLPYFFSFLP